MKMYMSKEKSEKWLEEYLPGILSPQGKSHIMKKLKVDEKEVER